MSKTGDLCQKACKPCEGGVSPMSQKEIDKNLKQLSGWALHNGKITKIFQFSNYHETMAFVNASAWVSHRENHHPDIELGYNQCRIQYHTHAIQGLSENDFICAAKIDALFLL